MPTFFCHSLSLPPSPLIRALWFSQLATFFNWLGLLQSPEASGKGGRGEGQEACTACAILYMWCATGRGSVFARLCAMCDFVQVRAIEQIMSWFYILFKPIHDLDLDLP